MAKRTYQASLQFLVISFVVQSVMLQATGILSVTNASIPSTGIPSTVTPHEARNASISNSPAVRTGSSQEAGNKTTLDNASTAIPATRNTANFPSLLSTFAQTVHSFHTEVSHPSETTAETTTEVTHFSTESFVSNSSYQSPSKVTASAITRKETTQSSSTAALFSSQMSQSVSASQLPAAGPRMKNSEFILTVTFALILTLTILGLLVYILNKYRMQRAQYSHHQLHDTSVDTVDRYATPDDTLVISGGLYDAPRIYDSSMTAYEDEELQTDHLPFGAQPGQFRLEFFGEKEKGISLTSETLPVPPGSL